MIGQKVTPKREYKQTKAIIDVIKQKSISRRIRIISTLSETIDNDKAVGPDVVYTTHAHKQTLSERSKRETDVYYSCTPGVVDPLLLTAVIS